MKKFILFACILASFLLYNAQAATKPVVINNNNQSCEYSNNTKCSELISSMHNKRATLYNVLNLSNDQQKCKEVIDQKRFNEIEKQNQEYLKEKYVLDNMSKHNASTKAIKKQEKLVKNIEKTIKEINNKYDKEFKSILNSEQKGKYNTIRKIEKKEINNCIKNKTTYKHNPKLRPFGEKMYTGEQNEVLCPTHHKWHIFGFKHKVNQ